MTRVSSRHVILGLLLCGAIAYLVVAMRAAPPAPAGAKSKKDASNTAETAKAEEGPVDLRLPEEVAFSRYQRAVDRNIFAPPGAAKLAETKKPVPPPPPFPDGTNPTPPPGPRPPAGPDFTGWSYAGYTLIGDQKIGVLQNEGNDRMEQVPLGGQFMGAKAKRITAEEIVFSTLGGDVRLSSPREFPVVSLSKSAAGTPSRPAGRTSRAQPGQPSYEPPPPPPQGEQ